MAYLKEIMRFKKSVIHIQYAILLILVVFLTVRGYEYVYLNFYSSWNDAGGFISLLDSIRTGQGMVSPAYNSGTWFFEISNQTPLAEWCKFPSVNRFANFSRWHPYLILFPIGEIANVFSVSSSHIISILTTLSYWVIILISVIVLWYKKIGILSTLAFLFIILIYTPWFGGLTGQLQSDRLMIGITFILVLYCYKFTFFREIFGKLNYPILSLIYFVGILISERSVIYCSLIILTFAFTIDQKKVQINRIFIIIGSSGIIYFLMWKYFVEDSTYYSKISFTYFFNNIENSLTNELNKTAIFLLVVVAPFIYILTKLRYTLLLLFSILPNFLWTTGGGEKDAFTTQYHAGYVGIICAVGLIAYSELVKGNYRVIFQTFIFISICMQIGFYILIAPTNERISSTINFEKVKEAIGLNNQKNAYLENAKNQKLNFIEKIENDAWVSTPEYFVTALVDTQHHNLDYLPFGITRNRYAIIPNLDIQSDYLNLLPPWLEYIYPNGAEGQKAISNCAKLYLNDYTLIEESGFDGISYSLVELRNK
jgi:hypothetical protein